MTVSVGVLGTGAVGRRLAAGFRDRGHEVMIGSREGAASGETLADWLSGEGRGVRHGTFAEAAEFGELLVLAVLGNAAEEVIERAGSDPGPADRRSARGDRFSGKVVIDAMNPLDFSSPPAPRLSIIGEDSLGERVQRAIPDAKVVKAFNTIGNPYFIDPKFSEGQPTMFIAGEDAAAKEAVTEVLHSFGWADVVDIGGIDGSRELEAMCILWVKVGLQRGAWDHGLSLLAG